MRSGPAEMADNDLAADQKNIISRNFLDSIIFTIIMISKRRNPILKYQILEFMSNVQFLSLNESNDGEYIELDNVEQD